MEVNKRFAKNDALQRVIIRLKRVICSRRFWSISGILFAVAVIVQLVLPYDKSFVGARIDGQDVGLKSQQEIIFLIENHYKNATVTTINPDTKTPIGEAGIVIEEEKTAAAIVEYPLWQRLIPFSSLYRLANATHQPTVRYTALPLSQWAKQVSDACRVAPVDATIAVTGEGTLAVIPSKKGAQCSEDELAKSLKNTPVSAAMTVDAKRVETDPKRSDQQVSEQLGKIQAVVDQGISVKVLDTVTDASPEDIISWLEFTDGENGKLTLDVNSQKIQPFIDLVQQPIYIAPGTTVIYMLDGQETGRIEGGTGRGIDSGALVEVIREQLRSLKTAPIEAQAAVIPAKQDIRRSYTNSTAGLQALIKDIADEHGDMAIAITELSGQGRALSANGVKQYHPASTYKLMVAFSVVKRIEAKQLKWEDDIDGQTVDECMTRMIVNSDNACAESFGEKFTWRAIQSDLQSIGMTGTNLNIPEPVSTVSDQVHFLKRLHNKELMNPENTQKLLDLMKRQVHRGGIPAGVGYEVADKVGFLSGLLHDSAIVYAPSGTYVLSIYSNGGTWGDIADVTRRINDLISS